MTLKPQFFLAIRHKPSGGFLPAVSSYGFTRTTPSLDDPPRLFGKMGPCKQALARWLEGEHFEGPDDDNGLLTIKVVRPAVRRIAAEMEIVEIELIVRLFDPNAVTLRRL